MVAWYDPPSTQDSEAEHSTTGLVYACWPLVGSGSSSPASTWPPDTGTMTPWLVAGLAVPYRPAARHEPATGQLTESSSSAFDPVCSLTAPAGKLGSNAVPAPDAAISTTSGT